MRETAFHFLRFDSPFFYLAFSLSFQLVASKAMDRAMLDAESGPSLPPFFRTVIETVVDNWKDNKNLQVMDNVLWPVHFKDCRTDFERVRLLLSFPSIRKFKIGRGQFSCLRVNVSV